MIVELDGSQHYEQLGIENDKVRDGYFKSLGLTVLRYSNYDVDKNFDGVCSDILRHLSTSSASLHSAPSPQGEGVD